MSTNNYLKYTGEQFGTAATAGTKLATALGIPLANQTEDLLVVACNGNSRCAAFTINTSTKQGQLYENIRTSVLAPNLTASGSHNTYLKAPEISAIRQMEKELSHDITEIRHEPGTMSASFKETYNNSMLTGVIWAMLGTTLMVYAFRSVD
jgi:hypothetical protein